MRRAESIRFRLACGVRGHVAWASLVLGLAAIGCSSDEEEPAESVYDESIIPQVAVPAADGPQLVATRHRVVIRDRPAPSGKVLGTLRAGARVARAEEPYSRHKCAGGWYPIRPRGFVCAGAEASINLATPLAVALEAPPNLDRALPYRYGQAALGGAVTYGTLPSITEQLSAEPKLKAATPVENERLGNGANDVPLDDRFLPTGPPFVQPGTAGVGDDGVRLSATFFHFDAPPPLAVGMSLLGGEDAQQTSVLRRNSGVAVVASLPVGQDGRQFGVMPDGRFVPLDRLEPALGTTEHGIEISEEGLPVAFALRVGVHGYKLDGSTPRQLDDVEYERRQAIPLTGRFRTVNDRRYYATQKENVWVRHKDIIMILKRTKFPDWATPSQKWLDISLANQTMVAWVGRKPLFATLISSGKDRLGDPNTGPSTPQGVFRFQQKAVTADIDDREVGLAYSISEAPWHATFTEGAAIVGAYWHTRFGEATGYHDIAVSPIDAHWLWHWSDPEVPEGWHSVLVDGEDGPNTIIYVHK